MNRQARRRTNKRILLAAGAVLAVIVLIVALGSHGSSSPKTTATKTAAAGAAPQVTLLTKYRPGYANTECLQMPGSAQVRLFIYMDNKGATPGAFNQDIQAIWLDLNGKTVDAAQNTMLAPFPKIQPHLAKEIYSDFPASGEQPIIKCWIRVGFSTKEIPIHVQKG